MRAQEAVRLPGPARPGDRTIPSASGSLASLRGADDLRAWPGVAGHPPCESGPDRAGSEQRAFFGCFPGGEIACVATQGTALGSWSLRGVLWLDEAGGEPARRAPEPGPAPADRETTSDERGPAVLAWIADDHVLSSAVLQPGEPFHIEEICGRSWHLELHLGGGCIYTLEPARS
jgi:hypothetical protein